MPEKAGTYQPINDISLHEFLQWIPDEAAAERYLIELRWCGQPACPKCGSENVRTTKNRKPQPFRCRTCRNHFSVRADTVMARANISLHMCLYAIYLLATHPKGVASSEFAKELGITRKSAWFLAHRVRKAWVQKGGLFAGPAEADETCIAAMR